MTNGTSTTGGYECGPGTPSQQLREYQHGVWTAQRLGKSVTYTYQYTYAGTTVSIDLDLEAYAQINRVDQMWNDATSKDFYIRAYQSPSNAYYAQLQSLAGNTSTSELLQLGPEYKYPTGGRLRFYYENYTAGKIVKIVVQVDEI